MFKQLTYCIVALTAFTSISNGQKSTVKPRKASILYCDSATLRKYHAIVLHHNLKYDSGFNNMLFHIINEFNGRPLDTTIITTGKLDEMGSLCIIKTRVYLYNDTVFVDSKLYQKNRQLWRYSFKEGFLPEGFKCTALLLDSIRQKNFWVYFTCGIYNGPPEFVNDSVTALGKPASWPDCWFKNMSLDDLKKKGIQVNRKQYRAYLTNFKGDLVAYGDELSKERLYIWYSPAKCFILFYAP
jgi:hypothetical protein